MADFKLIQQLQVPTNNNAHLTRNGKEETNSLVRLVLQILNGLGLRTAEQVNAKNFRHSILDKNGNLQKQFQARTLSADPRVLKAISEMSSREIRQHLKMIPSTQKVSNFILEGQATSEIDNTLSMISSMLEARLNESILREFKSTVTQEIIPQFIADFDAAQVEEGLTNEFQELLAKTDGSILSKFKVDRERGNPDVRLGQTVLTTCNNVQEDANTIDTFLGVDAESMLSFAAQYLASQAVPVQFMGDITLPIMMKGIESPIEERYPNFCGRDDSVEVELIRTENGITAHVTYQTDLVLVDPSADDENKHEIVEEGPTFRASIDFVNGAFVNMQVS
ncbi:MAG: hypothetical protein ChlgKO_12900 [Chlamydiales bacterium]